MVLQLKFLMSEKKKKQTTIKPYDTYMSNTVT